MSTSPKRKRYTVILLYPDYTDAGSWPEYYVAWARGSSHEEAIAAAREQAVWHYEKETENPGGINDPTDFALVGSIDGWHRVYGE